MFKHRQVTGRGLLRTNTFSSAPRWVHVLPPHADVVQMGRLPERFDELSDCGRWAPPLPPSLARPSPAQRR